MRSKMNRFQYFSSNITITYSNKVISRKWNISTKWMHTHIHSNFLKAVFHKFYLVHSWIVCPICKQLTNFLSKFQCRFRKGHGTEHCQLLMLEKSKKDLANKEAFVALLTDLSKAFDWLQSCIWPSTFITETGSWLFTKP